MNKTSFLRPGGGLVLGLFVKGPVEEVPRKWGIGICGNNGLTSMSSSISSKFISISECPWIVVVIFTVFEIMIEGFLSCLARVVCLVVRI